MFIAGRISSVAE